MDVGRVGVWCGAWRSVSPAERRDIAGELDELGWGTLWLPGGGRADTFAMAEELLRCTRTVKVAIGGLDAAKFTARWVAGRHAYLQSAFGRRLLLGLRAVPDGRGGCPATEREIDAYLDSLDGGAKPLAAHERLLAVAEHGMTRLAGRRALGVCPLVANAAWTSELRTLLGDPALIAPHQLAVVDDDARRAQRRAREVVRRLLSRPGVASGLRARGFSAADVPNGGSDRLVNALVVWGGPDVVAQRVRDHIEAGADHVALEMVPASASLPRNLWQELAPLVGLPRSALLA